MDFDTLQIVSATIFGTVLLFVAALYWLYIDGTAGRRAASRRLHAQAGGKPGPGTTESLRRQRPVRISLLARIDGRVKWLDRLVRQAGLRVAARHIVLFTGIVSVAILIALTALTSVSEPAGAAFAAIAAMGLSVATTLVGMICLRARRMGRFAAQLPDALDIMVRSLRAGHPINGAMTMVSREMADPIGAEFSLTVSEMTYGLDLRDALVSLAERVAVPDLHYVTVAIKIQHETGGNLAEVLHGLSTVIRARMRMHKKIRALSGEGRLSARVLAIMPIVFTGLVYVSRPDFYSAVADDPLFYPIIGVAVGLEVLGILIMRRLVTLHV